ncbi:MAG: hypothetical protein ABFD66_07070 [Smithella sp.]
MNANDFEQTVKRLNCRQIAWQEARNQFYSDLQAEGRLLRGMRMHLDNAPVGAVTLPGHERDYTERAANHEAAQTLYDAEIVPLDTAIKKARCELDAVTLETKIVEAENMIEQMKEYFS